MSANQLLANLKSAGLKVVEEPGWATRGNRWNVNGKPEGVMQHHTAPPNPYPIKALYPTTALQYRIKCNMATHPDGTLFMVAYKACNYSSGPGMLDVLKNNVRKSIAPTHNALKRGLKGGNRHFWNYENSHPGDGSPIPEVQLETIIESTRIVINHFELDVEQIISHAEWTRRKIDPRWNGSNRIAINQIREGVRSDDMAIMADNIQQFWVDVFDELGKLDPATSASFAKALVEFKRNHQTGGGITEGYADGRYVRKGQPVTIKGTT